MVFSCFHKECDGKFTEKRNLVRHVKNQHANLWSCQRCSQTFNRCDNYEYHQRTCLFKTNGKRCAEDNADTDNKRKRDNVTYIGGALDGTLADYQVGLEHEPQDASNIYSLLKESIIQLKSRIGEELKKKRAIKFYIALHANFHLATDITFITNPPAVLVRKLWRSMSQVRSTRF